jgi:DNA-binding LacI/PurR family transcriptional regulator
MTTQVFWTGLLKGFGFGHRPENPGGFPWDTAPAAPRTRSDDENSIAIQRCGPGKLQDLLLLQLGQKANRFRTVTRPLRRLPLAEQTAAHLREGFQSGRWAGQLPGVTQLADELAVSKHVLRAALKLLETEGWLEDCGAGRPRRILANPSGETSRRSLRIGVLLDEPFEKAGFRTVRILLGVRFAIEAAGHTCVFSDQYLEQMGYDLSKISRYVRKVAADAWIVCAAPRAVLEWFIAQPFPVYAYGGRFQNLPVACHGSRGAPAIEAAVDKLVTLGHRRIVLLAITSLRRPTLIPSLENYLTCLKGHGIDATDYHLPHIEDSAEGVASCLDSLFRLTPPTALLVLHTNYFVAVASFLARRGLKMPQDVSVVSSVTDPILEMHLPPIDQIHVPWKPIVDRIVRWVNGVAKGRPDTRQEIFDDTYVPGGTVGRVKK